jgi:hypothetical protein
MEDATLADFEGRRKFLSSGRRAARSRKRVEDFAARAGRGIEIGCGGK